MTQLMKSVALLLFCALLRSSLLVGAAHVRIEDDHKPGFCSTYGICGHRKDKDVLNCVNSTAAQPVTLDVARKLQDVCPQLYKEAGEQDGKYCCSEEQIDVLSRQIQIASLFLVGCPACNHNFKQFFCLLTCSPDQATFTNVTQTQQAFDTNATVVKEVDYYVSANFGGKMFNSCKDVVYPVLNQKAMQFVGGGAHNFQEWFDFIGTVKDQRQPPAGSPFQMNFPPEKETPPGMTALNGSLPSCWGAELRCSCGDCPDGPQCVPPPEPKPPPPRGCAVLGLRHTPIACLDVVLFLLFLHLAVLLPAAVFFLVQRQRGARLDLASLAAMARGKPPPGEEPLLDPEEEAEAEAAMDAAEFEEAVQYPVVERNLRAFFRVLGERCAARPWTVLLLCALLIALCALGLARFRVETDPKHLWVAPGSVAAREKIAYELAFGEFYRIEQLILSTNPGAQNTLSGSEARPPIVNDDNIRLMFAMQAEVDALSVPFHRGGGEGGNATLKDVCYKPMGDECATQSVLQYWKMIEDNYAKGEPPYYTRLSPEFCFSHWSTQCLSAFGAPMDPHLVLGGFPSGPDFRNYSSDATAFVVTYPLDSSQRDRAAALAWEAAFVELARGKLTDMAGEAGLRLSFSSERSVQDEVGRESGADVSTVALSYLVMLAYIAFALGYLPSGARARELLVTGRVSLAAGGVGIVAAAVLGSLGLCSLMGMWSTLISMEVIPFLVLAVGVDNMFILAHALAREDPAGPLVVRVGGALAAAGPSITLAASCEVVAFMLGAFSSMPAIRYFSLCAALAVALDYLLQVTAFVALLALDARRIEQRRCDLAPCVVLPKEEDEEGRQAAPAEGGPWAEERSVSAVLHRYMTQVHAPWLLQPRVQAGVLIAFAALFLLSLGALPHVSRGLEQQVALPKDSFLQAYYEDVFGFLRVGPPLMLVVKNLNVSRDSGDVNSVCSIAGCKDESLLNRVGQAARGSAESYIAAPAASWLDDFLTWISPEVPRCCRVFPGHEQDRCPAPDQSPCDTDPARCARCTTCFRSSGPPGPDLLVDSRPDVKQVQQRLPWFLAAKPSTECAKGGAGAYTDAIQASAQDISGVAGLKDGLVATSSFRTSYTPLSAQADFINAMEAVKGFVKSARRELGLDVHAYSIFHIFFEQYLEIRWNAAVMLTSAGVAVGAVVLLFTGSAWASAVIMAVLLLIEVDLLGAMVVLGIQLNAVSLVNLVMALGISVEFCAHLVHAFAMAPGPRPVRAAAALAHVGASVLSGITLTKFAGVVVLAFARTRIFEVYYFRMYLALVLVAAAHALLLLPVLLALLGPPPLPAQDGKSALQELPHGAEVEDED